MPNKEGGYGGYRQPDRRSGRKVRTAGSADGTAHRRAAPTPDTPARRTAPQPEATRRPVHRSPNALEDNWLSPQEVQSRLTHTAPAPSAIPDVRQAHRRSALRRARRRFILLATAAGILVVSGVITLLLPPDAATPPSEQGTAETAALATRLVAPLPYAGGSSEDAQTLDWGTVGPRPQTDTHTYTALPVEDALVPACGRVTTEWFADAAFLGDSLTAGYTTYDINLGGARVLGYEGVSPNTFVNRTVVSNADGEDEVPLDILAGDPPAKLYLMVGTNALVGGANDEGFLAYYGQLLDTLRTLLPDTQIYVQSILPVRPEALDDAPGLSSDHLSEINASLRAFCNEKGCLYLDVASVMTDDTGALRAEYAQPDGIHLTVEGYNAWVSYLCTHVPYDKDNPYQAGSTYYLDDSVKALLSDLP